MQDPQDLIKEETVTRVWESPGQRQETTCRTAGRVVVNHEGIALSSDR